MIAFARLQTNIRTRIQKLSQQTNHQHKPGLIPLAFLLPTIFLLLIFQLSPAIYTIYLSLTQLRRGDLTFIGWRNYERLFQLPSFTVGVQKTLIFSVNHIVITVILGMCLALLLNRKVRFTRVYLILLFIPWVLSDVVTGTMWRWLFQPSYGLIQEWISQNISFFTSPFYTTPGGSMFIVIAASIWQGLAFTTLLSLGALQTVPRDMTEAAAIDGANRFQQFFLITFPLIRPTFLILVLLVSIRAINTVGLIYATTGGGPGRATQTLSVYLLTIARGQGDFGMGAAISVIMFAINIVLTLFYLNLTILRSRQRVSNNV